MLSLKEQAEAAARRVSPYIRISAPLTKNTTRYGTAFTPYVACSVEEFLAMVTEDAVRATKMVWREYPTMQTNENVVVVTARIAFEDQ